MQSPCDNEPGIVGIASYPGVAIGIRCPDSGITGFGLYADGDETAIRENYRMEKFG
jgi:hypothetical protein